MSSLARALRYPRLVIVACYVAIVLGSVAFGMHVASHPADGVLDVLPTVVTVLLAILVLHHAYTRA